MRTRIQKIILFECVEFQKAVATESRNWESLNNENYHFCTETQCYDYLMG